MSFAAYILVAVVLLFITEYKQRSLAYMNNSTKIVRKYITLMHLSVVASESWNFHIHIYYICIYTLNRNENLHFCSMQWNTKKKSSELQDLVTLYHLSHSITLRLWKTSRLLTPTVLPLCWKIPIYWYKFYFTILYLGGGSLTNKYMICNKDTPSKFKFRWIPPPI